MELQQLLVNLQSSDNNVRKQAESFYSAQLEKSYESCMFELTTTIATASLGDDIRSMASVLLRQAIIKYSDELNREHSNQMFQKLFEIWSADITSPLILKRLNHVLAQFRNDAIIPLLLNNNMTLSDEKLLLKLELLEKITEYSPEQVNSHINVLGGFYAQYLSSTNKMIQIVTARVITATICVLDDINTRNSFKAALPLILSIIMTNDESEVLKIIENFIAIGEMHPLFFKNNLQEVVLNMYNIIQQKNYDYSIRMLSLELLITMTESAPAMIRRCEDYMNNIVPVCLNLMLEIDDEDENNFDNKSGNDDDDEEEDEELIHRVGEQAIERIALNLGGKLLGPLIMKNIQLFLQNGNNDKWQYRRASIVCLIRFAEGAVEVFKEQQFIVPTLNYFENGLNDTSSRVCYESIQGIGQFALLYADLENFQLLFPRFAPLLIKGLVIQNFSLKIRSHCANALINFMKNDHCDIYLKDDANNNILNTLLENLYTVLSQNLSQKQISQPSLTLLGYTASVAEELFVKYYSNFMPGIKFILSDNINHDNELRGKAMECVGLIGEAVGNNECFTNDAVEIMKILINNMNLNEQNDDMIYDYILPACVSISKAIGGEKFESFTSFIMNPIMLGINRKIDLQMEDVDGDSEDPNQFDVSNNEETGMQSSVVDLGGGVFKKVSLNTHAVQIKKSATSILYEFVSVMKGYLHNYLGSLLDTLLPLVLDKHSSEIRSSASLGLARIFEAIIDSKKINKPINIDLSLVMNTCITNLLKSLNGEINPEARASSAESLRDIILACYNTCTENIDGTRDINTILCKPDMQSISKLSKELLNLSNDSLQRRYELTKEFANSEVLDEDEDGNKFQEDIDIEDELLSNLIDTIGQFIKLHGEEYMQNIFVNNIAPHFLKYMKPIDNKVSNNDNDKALQVIAICMIDDAIEYGGVSMNQYLENSLPIFLNNLNQKHVGLLQSSTYGIAQICNKAPYEFIYNNFNPILNGLGSIINNLEKNDEYEGTIENALFGLGCLLSRDNQSQSPFDWNNSKANISQLWLQGLPLTADEQEAKLSHYQLCNFVESMDQNIIGNSMSNLPIIKKIFNELLQKNEANALIKNQDDKMILASSGCINKIQTILKSFP